MSGNTKLDKMEDITSIPMSKITRRFRSLLFYLSLLVIFYTIFTPSLSPLLNYVLIDIPSDKVRYIPWLITIALLWLTARFITNFFKQHGGLLLAFQRSRKTFIPNASKRFGTKRWKGLKDELFKEMSEEHRLVTKLKQIPEDERDEYYDIELKEKKLDFDIAAENYTTIEMLEKGDLRITMILFLMDVIAPILLMMVAIVLSFSTGAFEHSLHTNSSPTEYHVESATLEVKNIELKQVQ